MLLGGELKGEILSCLVASPGSSDLQPGRESAMKRFEGSFGLSARLTGGGIDGAVASLICDELATELDLEAGSEIDEDWTGSVGLGERFGERAGGIVGGIGDFVPELLDGKALGGGIDGIVVEFCGVIGDVTWTTGGVLGGDRGPIDTGRCRDATPY